MSRKKKHKAAPEPAVEVVEAIRQPENTAIDEGLARLDAAIARLTETRDRLNRMLRRSQGAGA